jgi:F0F1-type ATP synthase membrane subunit c/vacuolar-type H+-ATPase subunit K
MDPQVAKIIAAGLCVVAVLGPGVGLGILFGNIIAAIGRNPAAADAVKGTGLIYFALIEALALFALGMAFFFIYAV